MSKSNQTLTSPTQKLPSEVAGTLMAAKTGCHDWFWNQVGNVEVWCCEESDSIIRERAAEVGLVLEPVETLVNIRYRVCEPS